MQTLNPKPYDHPPALHRKQARDNLKSGNIWSGWQQATFNPESLRNVTAGGKILNTYLKNNSRSAQCFQMHCHKLQSQREHLINNLDALSVSRIYAHHLSTVMSGH